GTLTVVPGRDEMNDAVLVPRLLVLGVDCARGRTVDVAVVRDAYTARHGPGECVDGPGVLGAPTAAAIWIGDEGARRDGFAERRHASRAARVAGDAGHTAGDPGAVIVARVHRRAAAALTGEIFSGILVEFGVSGIDSDVDDEDLDGWIAHGCPPCVR